MTTFRWSNAAAKAMLDAATALINVGGAGSIKEYTGAAPTNVEDAPTGTLLSTNVMSATAFGASTDLNPGALATAASITNDASMVAGGTPGYARIVSGAGTAVCQFDVGTSGATLIEAAVPLVAGAAHIISALTIIQPET